MSIKIYRTPQRGDGKPDVSVEGEVLIVGSERYDLSYISEPVKIGCALVPAPVFRLHGDLHVQLIEAYGDDEEPCDHDQLPSPPESVPAPVPLTGRQLRLTLIANGIALEQVEAAIDGIEDAQARAVARVEWEYASQFERSHTLIAQVAANLGLEVDEVDKMWAEGLIR